MIVCIDSIAVSQPQIKNETQLVKQIKHQDLLSANSVVSDWSVICLPLRVAEGNTVPMNSIGL